LSLSEEKIVKIKKTKKGGIKMNIKKEIITIFDIINNSGFCDNKCDECYSFDNEKEECAATPVILSAHGNHIYLKGHFDLHIEMPPLLFQRIFQNSNEASPFHPVDKIELIEAGYGSLLPIYYRCLETKKFYVHQFKGLCKITFENFKFTCDSNEYFKIIDSNTIKTEFQLQVPMQKEWYWDEINWWNNEKPYSQLW
jgi:hypothetical protein